MTITRTALPILLCAWMGAESLSAAPILGYEISLMTRRNGFRFYDAQVSAAQLGTGKWYRLDTNSEGDLITGSMPSSLVVFTGTSGPQQQERATATVAVSPDPFKARMGSGARTLSDGSPVSSQAYLQFGDLVRIQGPGSEVQATFELNWTLDLGGFIQSRYSGSDLGIDGDPLQLISVAALQFESAFFLESTVLESSPGTPFSYFYGGYSYDEVVLGEMRNVGGPYDWDWFYLDSEVEQTYSGDLAPTVLFGPKLPWAFDATRDVTVRYRATVTVPTGVDLNLVGRVSGYSNCHAPSCFIQVNSLNSAGVGIVLPEGYSLLSALGASYPPQEGLNGGGGNGGLDPGTEIPEPYTASLAAAGLLILAVARRFRS